MTNPAPKNFRLVSRGDAFDVITVGRKRALLQDNYAKLLEASWTQTILSMFALYIFINLIFSGLYLDVSHSIINAKPHYFPDAFFFSVQTFSTIGYGNMYPGSLYANFLVTIESMCGFAFYGVVAGLFFSKFSRPTARILFANQAIIGMHDGQMTFMLRMANERNNRIVNAKAKLTLMRDENTKEGQRMRRFYDLSLIRSEIPFLRLTWVLRHPIDESSPLWGMTIEDIKNNECEIIVSLTGLDETFSQTVHARHSYIGDEILANAEYADIIHRRQDFSLEVRYDRFHDIISKEAENK